MFRKTREIWIAATIVLCAGAAAWAGQLDREFSESWDVSSGDRLELRHGDGDVTVRPSDDGRLYVDVRFHMTYDRVGTGREPTFDVEFERSGSTITVREDYRRGGGVGFSRNRQREYVYEVRAPLGMILDAAGEDGDISIRGWDGQLRIREQDGDVEVIDGRLDGARIDVSDGDVILERIDGDVQVRSGDGDVTIRDGRGDLSLSLSDGDVEVDRQEGSIKARSGDGDLTLRGLILVRDLRLASGDGDIDVELDDTVGLDATLETGDGDIGIRLGSGASVSFDLEARDGEVQVDGVAVERSLGGRRATGTVGSGAGTLRAETGGGEVILRAR